MLLGCSGNLNKFTFVVGLYAQRLLRSLCFGVVLKKFEFSCRNWHVCKFIWKVKWITSKFKYIHRNFQSVIYYIYMSDSLKFSIWFINSENALANSFAHIQLIFRVFTSATVFFRLFSCENFRYRNEPGRPIRKLHYRTKSNYVCVFFSRFVLKFLRESEKVLRLR